MPVQPSPHRALGFVLMCLRPAEIGQHPVAHQFSNITREPSNLASDYDLIGANDLAHFLWVESTTKNCRTHEIDKHDGELATFGCGMSALKAYRGVA